MGNQLQESAKTQAKRFASTGVVVLLALAIGSTTLTACGKRHGGSKTFSMKTVHYAQNGNSKYQTMDIYQPLPTGAPTPVLFWVHGGGWSGGDKFDAPASLFLKSGFAVASANYRLSNQAKFPAQIYDVKAAIRYLRAHAREYNLDVTRIGAFGMSAGGHLVALLGTTGGVKELEGDLGNSDQSSAVEAVCDWCGPTDFLTIVKQGQKENKTFLSNPKGPLASLLGGLPDSQEKLARLASPILFIKAGDPPFSIRHGDADQLVPVEQSQEFAKALKDHGVEVELTIVKDGPHNIATVENLEIAKDWFVQKFHVQK